MFKPWVSIPIDEAKVAVDYDAGDIRIMFRDVKTIDDVISQLENVRELAMEMETAGRASND
jgi:hypothetical protein